MPRTLIHNESVERSEFIEPDEPLENPPYEWEYDNATAREAATGFLTKHLGRLCHQIDDHSLWLLVGISPTQWQPMGGTSGHERAHSLHSSADHSNVQGTPTDGQALVYNAALAKWEPGSVSGAFNFLITNEGGLVYDNAGELVLKG